MWHMLPLQEVKHYLGMEDGAKAYMHTVTSCRGSRGVVVILALSTIECNQRWLHGTSFGRPDVEPLVWKMNTS